MRESVSDIEATIRVLAYFGKGPLRYDNETKPSIYQKAAEEIGLPVGIVRIFMRALEKDGLLSKLDAEKDNVTDAGYELTSEGKEALSRVRNLLFEK